MTDQEIMDKYFNIIMADYRSCYTGLDIMKEGYQRGTLEDMAEVFKEFFVGVTPLGLIDFSEISMLRPKLFPDKDIFYNYKDPVTTIAANHSSGNLCFFTDDGFEDPITIKVLPGQELKIQTVNYNMEIEIYGGSRVECYSSGSGEIKITLFDQSSALLVKVDNTNNHEIVNKGYGSFHFKEVKFNT